MTADEFKKALLAKMIRTTKDILKDEHYNLVKYGFDDFKDAFDVSEDFYTETLLEMRHEGLITIDLNGYEDLSRSIISATTKGIEFLENN